MEASPRPRPVANVERRSNPCATELIRCRSTRCPTGVPVQAEGVDELGRPLRMGTCPTCGRVTEEVDTSRPAPFEALTLF